MVVTPWAAEPKPLRQVFQGGTNFPLFRKKFASVLTGRDGEIERASAHKEGVPAQRRYLQQSVNFSVVPLKAAAGPFDNKVPPAWNNSL